MWLEEVLRVFTSLTAIKTNFCCKIISLILKRIHQVKKKDHTPLLDNTIKLPYLRTTLRTQKQKVKKKIPYLRTENLKNHTLFRGTYLYSPYMGVPPSGVFFYTDRSAINPLYKADRKLGFKYT